MATAHTAREIPSREAKTIVMIGKLDEEERSSSRTCSGNSTENEVTANQSEHSTDESVSVVGVEDVFENEPSWRSQFNWDDFGYSLILGFAPTAWDVFSDLRIATQLAEEYGEIHSAGLSYLFVCLPGLYLLNETLGEVLSDCSSALVVIVNLASSVLFSSAMIAAFWMNPLLFRYPAILIGIAVVITKGIAIFVHTPEMKKISKRVTMYEFHIESQSCEMSRIYPCRKGSRLG